MSRLANAILTGQFAALSLTPMSDLRLGGQNGWAPNLAQFCNSQAYVQRNLVALLIEAPTGFQYLPDPAFMVGALKALIELHPKSISGLARGLETDWVENAVSGGGEMQQDNTNVTRARSVPSFTYIEKYGRPIQMFIEFWITMLLADPDTKVAGITTLPGVKPTDLLADVSTCTILFFEADPSNTTINKAWLTTNSMPKATGDITGKRDLTTAMESSELTVEWTGISQSSLGVRLFAQALLDSINYTNANPNLAPAFVQAISSTVLADPGGYAANVQTMGASAV